MLAGLASAPPGAASATYYVSGAGSDRGTGSSSSPWRTIGKATATAPAGAVVRVRSGSYPPFAVTRNGQTVTAAPGASVVVNGRSGVPDTVLVTASNVTISDLTVTGCVPDPDPAGGFGDGGSSGVRVDDGTRGVTVERTIVEDGVGVNGFGKNFGCFGILAHNATGTRLLDNEIRRNGQGIYVNGGGGGTLISGNVVHDQHALIRNTPGGDDDFGGGGVAVVNVDASPALRVTGNTIYSNSGPSSDYGRDGGGFEIYDASHVQISGNTVYNNENVLETGTTDRHPCESNTFTGNTVSGRSESSGLAQSLGMLLRCADSMVIQGNTFSHLDGFVFAIDHSDEFAAGIFDLTITDNRVDQSDRVYYLAADPGQNRLVVDGNRFHVEGPTFASYGNGSSSASLQAWAGRTGLDVNSTTF